VQTTIEAGFGGNHSLCHGDMGNLELLLEVARQTGRPDLRPFIDQVLAGTLEAIETENWRTGVPHGIDTPSLLCGTAGIGYALLRMVDPEGVPAVLTLAPGGGPQA
jgi:lantibiotic modifying enzyme